MGMREVTTQELAPGMRVGKSVRASRGVLLLKEGVELTDQNIWVLKSWGVPSVWVEGAEASPEHPPDQAHAAEQGALEERVRGRFQGAMDHPVMEEIMRVALLILARREHNSKEVRG